jgi:hypothetical protein
MSTVLAQHRGPAIVSATAWSAGVQASQSMSMRCRHAAQLPRWLAGAREAPHNEAPGPPEPTGRLVLVARVASPGRPPASGAMPHGAPELTNPGLRPRSATLPQRE